MSKQPAGGVEDHSHDRIFVVTFLAVLAVLVGIAVVIAIIANSIDGGEKGMDPVVLEKTQQRLQPVGNVYTDASQIPAPAARKEDTRSAQEVADSVCATCHSSGLLDAPKTGDKAAWDKRLAENGGMEGLVKAAIVGKGSMPPRGGDAGLSDEQVRAAVELLLK